MNETDCELLELAAKAAGMTALFSHGKWNPLTDCGDALRLAVRLDIDIVFDNEFQRTDAYYGARSDEWVAESWHDDKSAATRRAIVRAAAEIGRGMS